MRAVQHTVLINPPMPYDVAYVSHPGSDPLRAAERTELLQSADRLFKRLTGPDGGGEHLHVPGIVLLPSTGRAVIFQLIPKLNDRIEGVIQ